MLSSFVERIIAANLRQKGLSIATIGLNWFMKTFYKIMDYILQTAAAVVAGAVPLMMSYTKEFQNEKVEHFKKVDTFNNERRKILKK